MTGNRPKHRSIINRKGFPMRKDYFLLFISFAFSLLTATASAQDIFMVARGGTVDQAKTLLAQDPKLANARNETGFTPLILAVYRGNNTVARYLVDSGADVNVTSGMGTALMSAAVKGNNEMALYLLEHKADPNIADEKGTTALIYAAMFRNPEMVKALLAHKADKTHKDRDGKTAFEHAVFSGNDAAIQLLK